MGVLHYIDLTIHPIDPFLKWRSLYDSIKMACSRKKEGMKRSQIQNPPCVLCLVWMCVFMFVCVRMFVCMCLCVCVCVYACLCVCFGRQAGQLVVERRRSGRADDHLFTNKRAAQPTSSLGPRADQASQPRKEYIFGWKGFWVIEKWGHAEQAL